jgi:hypothetical protein
MEIAKRNLLVNSVSFLVLLTLAISGLSQTMGGLPGLNRFQLITLHTYAAYAFLIMILVHLTLHRAWISAMIGGLFRKKEVA